MDVVLKRTGFLISLVKLFKVFNTYTIIKLFIAILKVKMFY